MKKISFLSVVLLLINITNTFSQTPGWKWGKNGIGNEFDGGTSIATDSKGNAIVTGYYSSDSIAFGGVTLQNNVIGYSDMVIAKYDSSGNVLWAQHAGGNENDRAISVATDAADNIYVTGYFYSDTIAFGTYTFISTDATADIFIVKYDSDGNILWARMEGGLGLDMPFGIALDDDGNVIVVGRFSSTTIVFGNDTLPQQGSMDVFVVMYDSTGNVVWARGAGSGSNDEAYAVDVDAWGNIYVAGYFNQNATFGTFLLTTEGQADIFLAKYDAAGTVLWVRGVGGDGDDRALSLSTDISGSIYLSGFYTNDTITFGSTPLPQEHGDNSFVAKYTPDGNAVWGKAVHGDSKANGVVVTNGNVYACGTFAADTITFGSDSLFIDGSNDFYLLKCDTNGNSKWIIKQTAGGGSTDIAAAVAADAWGNIFITGNFGSHDPINFGSDVLEPTDNSYDIFVARLGVNTVGIEDLLNGNTTVIYPNPGNGQFILQSDANVEAIEIYNSLGEKICAINNLKQHVRNDINVSSLPSGIYFVKLIDGEKQFTKKLIIQ